MEMKREIVIEDLWWRYKDRQEWALKGINLKIGTGEVIGIIGPAGAGKTTLCLALCGLIPQEVQGEMKGMVTISGMDTRSAELRDIVQKVGILFQDPESQFVSMSVLDEVAFGLENFGCPPDEMLTRVKQALKTVGMSGYEEKHPLELSGGQKQRVALASVLALHPRILILDEPTSNLDPIGKEEIFSVIHELKARQDTTTIIVENNIEELVEVVDHLILLHEGEVICQASVENFFKDVDFVKKKGVWVPQVTELCYRLLKSGFLEAHIPITLDNAQTAVREAIGDRRVIFQPTYTNQTACFPSTPAITAHDLHFIYPDGTAALLGIALIIYEGEYVAFLGQNGSGKTTLAKNFIGLFKPTSGAVTIEGVNTRRASAKELASKVGYIFQNPDHQLFCESIEEEVAFGPRNLGLSESETENRVREALKTVGMLQYRKEHPFSFGRAERQRIAISSILAMKPRIMIVDEPTAGQDMGLVKALMDLLDGLNKEGKTIIVIASDMRLVAEHAKRVVIIHQGKILLDTPTRIAFSQAQLLAQVALKPPQITRLAQALSDLGFPSGILTTDEMYDLIINAH